MPENFQLNQINGNSPNDNADNYNKELGNDKRFYFEHDSKP